MNKVDFCADERRRAKELGTLETCLTWSRDGGVRNPLSVLPFLLYVFKFRDQINLKLVQKRPYVITLTYPHEVTFLGE